MNKNHILKKTHIENDMFTQKQNAQLTQNTGKPFF